MTSMQAPPAVPVTPPEEDLPAIVVPADPVSLIGPESLVLIAPVVVLVVATPVVVGDVVVVPVLPEPAAPPHATSPMAC